MFRILSITSDGLSQSRIFVRSAALSYYSLIALGPVIALLVMITGFIIDQKNTEDFASKTINKAIEFVAPSTNELPDSDSVSVLKQDGETPPFIDKNTLAAKEELKNLINNFINSARSGTVGVVGSLMLIIIVIQLLITIEKTFNEIWGANRGRNFIQRIFFYWSLISLSAILIFSCASFFSVATLSQFLDKLPFGGYFFELILLLTPILAFFLTGAILAIFYKFFPNTWVPWYAASIGGFLAAAMLYLNYFLSFLYVSRVIRTTSLYGSVGIFPILMIGIYVFWLIILLGGQVSYATQNAQSMTHKEVWRNISTRTKNTLRLAVFILICRRFQACQTPYSNDELAALTRAPGQLLNECSRELQELGWIHPIKMNQNKGNEITRYSLSKPLKMVKLSAFIESLENYGNNEGFELVRQMDPLLKKYSQLWDELIESLNSNKTMEELLAETPEVERAT